MPPTILLHVSDPEAHVETVARAHPDVRVVACDTYEGLPDLLSETRPEVVYSVAFRGRAGFPRDALFGPSGPAWLAVGGVGVDHLGQWDPSGVTVTNSAGVAAHAIADYVIAGFLHFAMDVPGLMADQAARLWDSRREVRSLRGRTLLVVGLGHSGQAVAQRAAGFGMRVIGTRANPRPTPFVDEVHAPSDLPALWGRADAIAVCTPLLPSTRGLVNAAAIAAMKPGVWLADVSRGGVVDHVALRRALVTGRVGGAALDVFPAEPLPQDDPIWQAPNTLISPHCCAVTPDWANDSLQLFLRNLAHYRAGEALFNVVDPVRGY